MSMISSFLGSRLVVLPSKPTPKLGGGGGVGIVSAPPPPSSSSSSSPLTIECSSRPQKKGTAHHIKTRPKKTQPWDIKRKPTVYDPLPKLPPEWSRATSTKTSDSVVAAEVPSSTDNNNNAETSDSVVAAEVPSSTDNNAEVPSSTDNNNDDA